MHRALRSLPLLVLLSTACRALQDDQETRPLPAPLPPPQRGALERDDRSRPERPERPEPPPRAAARAPRPAEAEGEPPSARPAPAPTAPPEAAPEAAAPEPAAPASDTSGAACAEACRRQLESCITAPTAVGGSLETCKTEFEGCKGRCGG